MSDSDDDSPQQTSAQSINRRVVATRRGGSGVLRIVEDGLPEPERGEVRVRILATGVSFAELLMREGVHPETPREPITLGWDLVGVIDKLGADVSGVLKGETVAALPVMGGYADYICLQPDQLVAMPAAEAVPMVLNYMTVYQMLHRSARVEPGQRVLIHGAAGGIGTALLQQHSAAHVAPPGLVSGGSDRFVRAFARRPDQTRDSSAYAFGRS